MKTWLPKHKKSWQACLEMLADTLTAEEIPSLEDHPDPSIMELAPPKTDKNENAETSRKPEPPKLSTEPQQTPAVEPSFTEDATAVAQNNEVSVAPELTVEVEVSRPAEDFRIDAFDGKKPEAPARSPEPKKPEINQTLTRSYFLNIPWDGESSSTGPVGEAADVVQQPATRVKPSKPQKEDTETHTAKGFFARIPWTGTEDEIESIHVSAPQDDHELDPLDGHIVESNLLTAGLMSAARTSNRLSNSKEPLVNTSRSASEYFAAIPWKL